MNLDFLATLEKAEEVDGRYYISGIASTTDKDVQNDVITANALKEMAKSAVGVPIVTSHNHELNDEIGSIVEAHYSDNKLFIKAELDAQDPLAVRMYNKIAKAQKVGFSIGANVKRLAKNMDKSVRMTVDSVAWKHVMVTSKPVNQNTLCLAIAKALNEENMDDKEVKPTPENPLPHEGEISINGGEPVKIGPSIQGDNKPEHNDLGADMRKAGAKFSAETVASLKSIHAAGNDDVKSQVRSLMGDDASMLDDDGSADDSSPLGIVDKAVAEQLAAFKADLIKELTVTLAKSQTETPKAPEVEPELYGGRSDFHEILRKAISG
jgi:HK97 family phage prohead protease